MHYKLFDLLYLGQAVSELFIVVLKFNEVGVARALYNVVVAKDAQGLGDVLGLLLRGRLVENQIKDVLRFLSRFIFELRL